jgi:hypothetical protein
MDHAVETGQAGRSIGRRVRRRLVLTVARRLACDVVGARSMTGESHRRDRRGQTDHRRRCEHQREEKAELGYARVGRHRTAVSSLTSQEPISWPIVVNAGHRRKCGDYDISRPQSLTSIKPKAHAFDQAQNWAYATIPTVREILVVSSTEVRAELLRRGSDGAWPADPEALVAGDVLHLEAIALDCPLGEVYADTHLLR